MEVGHVHSQKARPRLDGRLWRRLFEFPDYDEAIAIAQGAAEVFRRSRTHLSQRGRYACSVNQTPIEDALAEQATPSVQGLKDPTRLPAPIHHRRYATEV